MLFMMVLTVCKCGFMNVRLVGVEGALSVWLELHRSFFLEVWYKSHQWQLAYDAIGRMDSFRALTLSRWARLTDRAQVCLLLVIVCSAHICLRLVK